MKPIRVLLADDHTLVRAGLRALLKELSGIDVVAEAGNGREAVRLVEQHHPDVVLMDIIMPELNGLDATARIAAAHPKTRVLILTMSAGADYVLQALRAGAAGYLLKNTTPAELEQAIRAVVRGEVHLSSAVAKHVVANLRQPGGVEATPKLTPRQREVLQLIAEGKTTKEIAKRLGLSTKTVETHRAELMKTLDIHEIAGLVRYAIRIGLVSPE